MRNIAAGTLALLLGLLLAPGMLQAQQTPERRENIERRVIVEAERRGWLGITYREGEQAAVAVEAVAPESPAARAGLQPGDSIVRWNGRADVREAMRSTRIEPGETVRLRVRRGGERDRELALSAAERPRRVVSREPLGEGGRVIVIDGAPLSEGARVLAEGLRIHLDSLSVHADSLHRRLRVLLRDSLGPRLEALERTRIEIRHGPGEARRLSEVVEGLEVGSRSVAGAELAPLAPEMSSYFGVSEGVLVLRVGAETPAARAGLQAGDVLVEVGGSRVREVRDVRRAVTGSAVDEVPVRIVRKGQPRDLKMEWE